MKKNRSNKFTTGVCDIIDNDRNRRFCFFEFDELRGEIWHEVLAKYAEFYLDVLTHRTMKGWHFLSPTEVTLGIYKDFHNTLLHLNKKCPMTTLRTEPNKYPNEDQIWYNHIILKKCDNPTDHNNQNMIQYLNHIFKCNLEGNRKGSIKIVRYPLPFVEVTQ